MRRNDLNFTNCSPRIDITVPTRLRLEAEMNEKGGRHLCYTTLANEEALARAYAQLQDKPAYRKNGSELQLASLVVDVHTGHIVGHYCSGVNDYTNYRNGFPIGSLGKPAIITQLLEMGASPNMTLFDGQIGKRKTPKNANHGWTRRYMGITEILSKSYNAPFANICDVKNPRTTFLGVEHSYQRMGIEPDETLCLDTYNYPLGLREMTVMEVASLYQTLINDGVHIPLRMLETSDSIQAERIYETQNVAVVKNALTGCDFLLENRHLNTPERWMEHSERRQHPHRYLGLIRPPQRRSTDTRYGTTLWCQLGRIILCAGLQRTQQQSLTTNSKKEIH